MAVKSAPVGDPVEKGARKRKAKRGTAATTALEANLHDPSRKLGLFLEDNVVSVQLAGVEYPGLDAPIAQKRQFSAAVSMAIQKTRERHPYDTWWKPVAEELEKVLGLRRRTAADPLRSIPEILHGTRLDPEIVQTSTVDAESSEESGDKSTSELEAPVRKRARLDQVVLRQIGLAGSPRKPKMKPEVPSERIRTKYPKLDSDHANWQKTLDLAGLKEVIDEYPASKTERHFMAPNYFNTRGELYLRGIGVDLVKEWAKRAKSVLIAKEPWPTDLWAPNVLRNFLARYNTTIARFISVDLLNARGEIRQKARPRHQEARDNSGQYVTASAGLGLPLNSLGQQEKLLAIVEKEVKEGVKDTRLKRLDVTRRKMNEAMIEIGKTHVSQEWTHDQFLAALRNDPGLGNVSGVSPEDIAGTRRQISNIAELLSALDDYTTGLEADVTWFDSGINALLRVLQKHWSRLAPDSGLFADWLLRELSEVCSEDNVSRPNASFVSSPATTECGTVADISESESEQDPIEAVTSHEVNLLYHDSLACDDTDTSAALRSAIDKVRQSGLNVVSLRSGLRYQNGGFA
ncbi:hypothetical protein ABEF95_015649 [Exophiala dermatitidis]